MLDQFLNRLTKERFARQLMRRLKAADGVGEVEYDRENFRLVVDGSQYINLSNFYDEHRRLPKDDRAEHLQSILQGVFQSGFELPEELEDAKPDLLPKIWPRAAFDRLDLKARVEGRPPSPLAAVPVGEHLYLGVVYDLPRSVRMVSQGDLEGWDTTLYEALEIATDNLRERQIQVAQIGGRPDEPQTQEFDGGEAEDSDEEPDFGGFGESGGTAFADDEPEDRPYGNPFADHADEDGGEFEPSRPRVFIFSTGDSYDATRLILLPDLDMLRLNGRPVALAPNRDVLIVCGDDDEAGLTVMASLASQMYDGEPRPHVPIPVTHDGEDWADFRVPPGHPAYDDLHKLEVRYLAEEYAEQKPILEELQTKMAEIGQDPLFVATPIVTQTDEGEVRSHAVWSKGVQALLPRTDYIGFMRSVEESEPVSCKWSDVAAVLDDLLVPEPDYYPPRWRVTEFPSDLALKILTEEPS